MIAKALAFDWDTTDENVIRHNTKTLIRFLKYCEKDENGLLYWDGCCFPTGYGKFQYEYDTVRAHRMAYALLAGGIPPQTCVLHRNDERLCVDPSMLYLGSYGDNTRDMLSRGRNRHGECRGEEHGNAKLTEKQVLEIRCRYRPGRGNHPNISDLAKEYGVSRFPIHQIITRRGWNHI